MYLDEHNVLRAHALDRIPWVEHGFCTRVSNGWPGDRSLTSVKQIHSNIVVVDNGQTGRIDEGDALITNRAGATVAVRTADCLPILIASRSSPAVAAVHAGWRGTVARIAANAIEAMMDRFGCAPEDLTAVIGPGIANCCFEVGPEVARQFWEFFPERDLSARTRIDLREVNRNQLIGSGIPEGQVVTAELCTCCTADLFHSYRRDRDAAGRMVSAIGIRG